jgi:hypothetical protein
MATMTYLPRTLSPEDREQERRLRALVSEYLSGALSLHDFEERFAAASWGAERFADPVQAFTYQVEHRLAEHRDGLTDEAGLQAELRDLLALVWHAPKRPTATAMAITVRHDRRPRRL